MKTLIVKPHRPLSVTTRCTPFDARLRWVHPRVGLCFGGRLDPARMADALAQVLPDYHAFAGRLSVAGGGLSIVPSADGVPMELVESSDSRQTLLADENSKRGLGITPRIPALRALRGGSALFAARLTQTREGSLLGVSWNHAIGDYASMSLLFDAWAKAYCSVPHVPGFDVPDRDAYLCKALIDSADAAPMLRPLSISEALRLAPAFREPQRRVMLELENDDLLAIQAAVAREERLTVEDAMWSQIFMAIRRLQNYPRADLTWIVDIRRRAKLPANLVGNATAMLVAPTGPHDDAATLAPRIRRLTAQFDSHNLSYHATRRSILDNSGWLQRKLLIPAGVGAGRMGFCASSLGKFDMSRIVFDPAAPVVDFCARPADAGFWNALAWQRPGTPQGRTNRLVSLWLPAKIASAFEGGGARSLLLGSLPHPRSAAPNSFAPAPGR